MIPSISLNKLGKKFGREWIFRNLQCTISPGQKLVILGGNGSGKSTLLQVISGYILPNEGEVLFEEGSRKIDPDTTKDLVAFASPYLQLVEDLTLHEMIAHANKFKPFVKNMQADEIVERIQLGSAKHKYIRQFSSGMKQRLKLGLAVLADTPVLLLDEPVSNLDRQAIAWYKELVADHSSNRTVIVCSNAIADEYAFCDTELNVMDFKK